MSIRQLEALPARASVRAIHVRADVGALVVTGLALINVHAVLPVVLRNYVTGIASADVAAVKEIMALVGATAAVSVRAMVIVICKRKRGGLTTVECVPTRWNRE